MSLAVWRNICTFVNYANTTPHPSFSSTYQPADQKALVNFKNGPFLPGVPVQPIIVRFPFTNFDPCWVTGGPSQPELLHRLLCQLHTRLVIEYLPVYHPSPAESGGDYQSAKLYARNVRKGMAEKMGVPCTEHSYEDVKLAGVAQSLHLPPSEALLNIGKAKPFLGSDVTIKTIEKHLNAFASMDTNKSGTVSFDQFSAAFDLDLDSTPQARALFDLICHGEDELHFRDYLFGLALINESPDNRRQLVKLAFTSFDDSGGKGMNLAAFSNLLAFNPELAGEDTEKIFLEADTDNDGYISFKEFDAFVKKPGNENIISIFSINFLDRSEILARKAKWRPSVSTLAENPAVSVEGPKKTNMI